MIVSLQNLNLIKVNLLRQPFSVVWKTLDVTYLSLLYSRSEPASAGIRERD